MYFLFLARFVGLTSNALYIFVLFTFCFGFYFDYRSVSCLLSFLFSLLFVGYFWFNWDFLSYALNNWGNSLAISRTNC